jgi:hypothetical protein
MALGHLSSDEALKAKLEARDHTKYRIDDRRKALGLDDSWFQSHLGKMPGQYRAQMHDVFHGTAPIKRAVKMMCYECVGHSDLKNAVSGCKASMCPLYAYRPHQD